MVDSKKKRKKALRGPGQPPKGKERLEVRIYPATRRKLRRIQKSEGDQFLGDTIDRIIGSID